MDFLSDASFKFIVSVPLIVSTSPSSFFDIFTLFSIKIGFSYN